MTTPSALPKAEADISGRTGIKLNLPVYSGEEESKVKADQFIGKVEHAGAAGHWDDATYVSMASFNMTGKANTWQVVYLHKYPQHATQWAQFRDAFLTRFHRANTITERTFLLAQLSMKTSESVGDFHDRVQRTIMELRLSNECILLFLLNGLTPSIKKTVEQTTGLVTEHQFLTAALAAEAAQTTKVHRANITAIATSSERTPADVVRSDDSSDADDGEPSSKDAEIAALQQKFQKLNNKWKHRKKPTVANPQQQQYRGSGGRNNSEPRRSGGGRSGTTGRSSTPNSTFCFRCRRYGNHFANNCPVPQEMLATLVPDVPHPHSNFGTYGQHGQAQSTSEAAMNGAGMNVMGAGYASDDHAFFRMVTPPIEKTPKN